jgi:hypothetical protein
MTIEPVLLLERLADTLRHEVGPAVEDPFAKTQAFMASVVLTKLAGQLRAGEIQDASAGPAAVVGLVRDASDGELPPPLADAIDALACDGSPARWNAVILELYAAREAVGADTFDRLLGVVRSALRARLDHVLAYAR